eukprot:3485848-Pyramimonas_sp.AAC.1
MVAELATASSRWAPPARLGALGIALAAAAAGRALDPRRPADTAAGQGLNDQAAARGLRDQAAGQ